MHARARLAGRTLAVAVLFGTTGCQVGSIHALDGEWPIPARSQVRPAPWTDRGGGPGGALARTGPVTYRLVTSKGSRTLKSRADLTGARVVGETLYRVGQDEVLRQDLDDLDDADETEPLARIEGARDLDVFAGGDLEDAEDDVLVVSGEGAVYTVDRRGARSLWEGDALAVAADPGRKAVWIAARAPLAVIECVDLESGDVRLRVPLPVELESASLVFVVGPRGVVAYSHDRPISSALLIDPRLGVALPLRARDDAPVLSAGSFEPSAWPPLCTPPGVVVEGGERLALGGDPGKTFGRIAALPDGAFLIVESGPQGVMLGRVLPPAAGAQRLTLQTSTPPPEWSGRVDAIGWDAEGAVLASSQDTLRVAADHELDDHRGRGARDVLRRGANYALAGTIAVVETTTALTLNTILVSPLVPLSPFALLLGEPQAFGAMVLAPVWMPWMIAFSD
jgi:hypothetical protein